MQAGKMEGEDDAQEACAAGDSAEGESVSADPEVATAAAAVGKANYSVPTGERRWSPGAKGGGRKEPRQTWLGRVFDSPAFFWACLVFAPGMQVCSQKTLPISHNMSYLHRWWYVLLKLFIVTVTFNPEPHSTVHLHCTTLCSCHAQPWCLAQGRLPTLASS